LALALQDHPELAQLACQCLEPCRIVVVAKEFLICEKAVFAHFSSTMFSPERTC
jgi:hypothetical protein